MWTGLFIGTLFGLFLERSGVLNPTVIIGQMQWRRFKMLRVFLSAIITGLIIYSVLEYLGYERLNWKVLKINKDIVGGALLGIGIAFAGSCPGTVLGQIGAGYKDALITIMGGFAGAFTFLLTHDYISQTLGDHPNIVLNLPQLLGFPAFVVSGALVIFFTIFLIAIRKLPS